MPVKAVRGAWRKFLRLVERSLARPYRPRMSLGQPGPEEQVHKKPELAYAPPSKRLVYATAMCMLALTALCMALLLCVILTGNAPSELTTSIMALASTLAGIYIGRKGDVGPR